MGMPISVWKYLRLLLCRKFHCFYGRRRKVCPAIAQHLRMEMYDIRFHTLNFHIRTKTCHLNQTTSSFLFILISLTLSLSLHLIQGIPIISIRFPILNCLCDIDNSRCFKVPYISCPLRFWNSCYIFTFLSMYAWLWIYEKLRRILCI